MFWHGETPDRKPGLFHCSRSVFRRNKKPRRSGASPPRQSYELLLRALLAGLVALTALLATLTWVLRLLAGLLVLLSALLATLATLLVLLAALVLVVLVHESSLLFPLPTHDNLSKALAFQVVLFAHFTRPRGDAAASS